MAQPEEAQPTSEPDTQQETAGEELGQPPEQLEPDRYVPSAFHAQVIPGPQGGRFMTVHLFNRREVLILDFCDDKGAQILSDELKPKASGIVTPNGNGKPGGLVLPHER